LLTAAVRLAVLPAGTTEASDVTTTLTPCTVIAEDADFDESEAAVATTLAFISPTADDGALYVADVLVTLVSVPSRDAGESAQVTPRLDESLLTVAESATVWPGSTAAVLGVTATAITDGGVLPLPQQLTVVIIRANAEIRTTRLVCVTVPPRLSRSPAQRLTRFFNAGPSCTRLCSESRVREHAQNNHH